MAETQRTTSTTQLPEYAETALRDVLGQAQSYFQGLPETYQSYPRTFAALNPLQVQARENLQQFTPASQLGQATNLAGGAASGLMGLANSFNPAQGGTSFYNAPQFQGMNFGYQNVSAPTLQNYQMTGPGDVTGTGYTAAQMQDPSDIASQDFTSEAAQRYMSPYIQNVIAQQKLGAIQDYGRALPGLGAAGATVGGLGGSRSALVQSEAQRNLYDRMAGLEATGLQNAYQQAAQQYNTDQGRQMQAQTANQQARLATAQQNVQALNQAGQFGAAQRLQADINNQQARLQVGQQNLAAQLGVQSLGANLGLQAQQANQSAGLQSQQQQLSQILAQNQFAQQNAATAAQYGLAGANLGLQGYQSALQGAGVLSGIGQNAYEQAMGITEAQMQAGTGLQAQAQAGLDAQYEDWLASQRYPMEQLGFYSNIVRGLPYGSTTTSTTQLPSGSSWGTAAGILGGLATLAND